MTSPDHPQTIVYYDGWCNACIKSADLFTKLDRNRGLLICVDFRSDDPLIKHAGANLQTLAASLHTLTPDGTLHAGPAAIRQAFNQLGNNHAAAWTAWPIIKPVFDLGYRIFARNRLRWFANHKCKDGSCTIDST
jgi:predicted DCC family thiol-disulfide oxidoreductase YuxK